MATALRELLASFGVEVEDKKLDAFTQKLESAKSTLENVGAAIGLAFGLHEITEFITGQIEMGAQLAHTSEMLGLGIGDLQAFQYAAQNAGLGADEANTALRFLNKNLGEAQSKGGDAAAAFTKLGVKLTDAGKARSTQDVFADVADGIARLPTAAAKTTAAMDIFGRAGARLIPLLNKGSKGIDEFYKEFEKLGGGIDEEFVKSAEEGEHQINKLSLAFRGVKSTIASALLPAFTWIVDKITSAVGWFREFSKHSYIVQTSLATLGAIALGLALIWAVLNIEIFAVVFALALLILTVDDIYTAFQGGKSVVGDFIDSLFGVGATQTLVNDLSAAARELWGDLGDVWEATKKMASALASLTGETDPAKAGLDGIRAVIGTLTDGMHAALVVVEGLENGITKVVGMWTDFSKNHPELSKAISMVASAATSATGAGAEAVGRVASYVQGDQPQLPYRYAAQLERDHGPTIINQSHQVTIDVGTTGSPNEAGKAVADGWRDAQQADLNAAYAASASNGGT